MSSRHKIFRLLTLLPKTWGRFLVWFVSLWNYRKSSDCYRTESYSECIVFGPTFFFRLVFLSEIFGYFESKIFDRTDFHTSFSSLFALSMTFGLKTVHSLYPKNGHKLSSHSLQPAKVSFTFKRPYSEPHTVTLRYYSTILYLRILYDFLDSN